MSEHDKKKPRSLSLSRRVAPKNSLRLKKPQANTGSVVVSVVDRKNPAKQNGKQYKIDSTDRRFIALERSKLKSKQTAPSSTLSDIARINSPVTQIKKTATSESVSKPITKTKKKQSKKELHDQTPEENKLNVKPKNTDNKKLKKSDIIEMLSRDDAGIVKTRSLASIKRVREKERRKNAQNSSDNTKPQKLYRKVTLPERISIAELASKMSERIKDVKMELTKLDVIVDGNQYIDADTAEIIASTMGHTVERTKESDIEDILKRETDKPEHLKTRPPIVTIMGHVDHGKTSLLDALRSTDIAINESGGITQHIGAYNVNLANGKAITFIDTPGHEAFTEMRVRGTQITDIVILVVAADDGIKSQTIEAISHAKSANVPIIVAINKIDKDEADISKVKNALLQHELIPEDLGGDVISVGISALKGKNLDKLQDAILLVAEMLELKANPNKKASGIVVESSIDDNKGVTSTLIVQTGTIRIGDILVAGTAHGKVRALYDDKLNSIKSAEPSKVVQLCGLNITPHAGEIFDVTESEKQARNVTDYRIRKSKNTPPQEKTSLEELFLKSKGMSKVKEVPLIVKGDVTGSVEAIANNIKKITHEEIKIKILHQSTGAISASDISLAKACNAIIIGFNVRTGSTKTDMVDIRYYSTIYELIDDIKLLISGMISPIIKEKFIGSIDIRQIFNISKVGKVAGCYVTKGLVKRDAGVRLLRDNVVIHTGKLKTLKRFKEDLKEAREGFECGITLERYDNIKIGDSIEVFEIVQEQKKL